MPVAVALVQLVDQVLELGARPVAGGDLTETDPQGRLFVEVEDRPDSVRTDERLRELETEYRAVVEEILELRGDDGRVQAFVRSIADPAGRPQKFHASMRGIERSSALKRAGK